MTSGLKLGAQSFHERSLIVGRTLTICMTLFEVSGSWDRSFLTLRRVSNDYVLGGPCTILKLLRCLTQFRNRRNTGRSRIGNSHFQTFCLCLSHPANKEQGVLSISRRRGKYCTTYLRVCKYCARIDELGRMNFVRAV